MNLRPVTSPPTNSCKPSTGWRSDICVLAIIRSSYDAIINFRPRAFLARISPSSSQALLHNLPAFASISFKQVHERHEEHTSAEMAQLGQEESSGGLAVPRLSLNQFEQLIGLYPAEQQADLWHSAAEAFENDENHPERWDRA